MLLVRTILILLLMALGLAGCQLCDDPVAPGPTAGKAELMYTEMLPWGSTVAPRIFRSRADGTDQRVYVTTSGYITDRGFLFSSPWNGRIAFHGDPQPQGNGDEIVDLVIANVDGSNATVLDADVSAMSVLHPVVSPNGDRVAVSLDKRQRSTDIVIYDVASRAKRTIASDLQSESAPFFTADGRRLFYYSSNGEIISIAADGSDRRVIVRDAFADQDYRSWLDISADGLLMVYMQKDDVSSLPRIAVCDLATGTSTPIGTISHYGLWPTFAPDGRSIAFVAAYDVSTAQPSTSIAIYDVQARTVRDLKAPKSTEWPMFPQWSPNGDMLCATVTMGSSQDEGTYTVRVYDVAAGTSALIASNVALAYWVR